MGKEEGVHISKERSPQNTSARWAGEARREIYGSGVGISSGTRSGQPGSEAGSHQAEKERQRLKAAKTSTSPHTASMEGSFGESDVVKFAIRPSDSSTFFTPVLPQGRNDSVLRYRLFQGLLILTRSLNRT